MRTPHSKMHRLVALVIALVLLITLALPAYAADSTDPITARIYLLPVRWKCR